MELGLPVIVVINKTDEAEERGITIAAKRLEERLGVSVVPMQANERVGMEALQVALSASDLAQPQWTAVKDADPATRYTAIETLLEERLPAARKTARRPAINGIAYWSIRSSVGWCCLVLWAAYFLRCSAWRAIQWISLMAPLAGWAKVEARMAEGDLRAHHRGHHWWRGRCGDFSAANSHPVFLHWAHGKHRLFGSCVLHDGSFDVRCGIEW